MRDGEAEEIGIAATKRIAHARARTPHGLLEQPDFAFKRSSAFRYLIVVDDSMTGLSDNARSRIWPPVFAGTESANFYKGAQQPIDPTSAVSSIWHPERYAKTPYDDSLGTEYLTFHARITEIAQYVLRMGYLTSPYDSHLMVTEESGAVPLAPTFWVSAQRSSRSVATQSLVDKIDEFRLLPADWDGEDTVLIDAQTVERAAALIDAALAGGFELPQASPSSEGEVGLTWFRGRDAFDVTITQDSHIIWLTRVRGDVEPGGVVEVGFPSWTTAIVEALREFDIAASNPSMSEARLPR